MFHCHFWLSLLLDLYYYLYNLLLLLITVLFFLFVLFLRIHNGFQCHRSAQKEYGIPMNIEQ